MAQNSTQAHFSVLKCGYYMITFAKHLRRACICHPSAIESVRVSLCCSKFWAFKTETGTYSKDQSCGDVATSDQGKRLWFIMCNS